MKIYIENGISKSCQIKQKRIHKRIKRNFYTSMKHSFYFDVLQQAMNYELFHYTVFPVYKTNERLLEQFINDLRHTKRTYHPAGTEITLNVDSELTLVYNRLYKRKSLSRVEPIVYKANQEIIGVIDPFMGSYYRIERTKQSQILGTILSIYDYILFGSTGLFFIAVILFIIYTEVFHLPPLAWFFEANIVTYCLIWSCLLFIPVYFPLHFIKNRLPELKIVKVKN